MTVYTDGGQTQPPLPFELPPRERLKRLILGANERELDKIIQAIAAVSGKARQ